MTGKLGESFSSSIPQPQWLYTGIMRYVHIGMMLDNAETSLTNNTVNSPAYLDLGILQWQGWFYIHSSWYSN